MRQSALGGQPHDVGIADRPHEQPAQGVVAPVGVLECLRVSLQGPFPGAGRLAGQGLGNYLGRELPTPESLDVELPAYLNGMGEAVGELRRHLLDTLRSGDVEQCEKWLRDMDEMYSVLVTVDYPDAMTGGLRRTTDSVRGILEKTRGDLTLSVQQRRLEQRLEEFGSKLG